MSQKRNTCLTHLHVHVATCTSTYAHYIYNHVYRHKHTNVFTVCVGGLFGGICQHRPHSICQHMWPRFPSPSSIPPDMRVSALHSDGTSCEYPHFVCDSVPDMASVTPSQSDGP